MNQSTAIWPVEVALADVLMKSKGLSALIGPNKVFNGAEPPNTPYDYVVIGDHPENPANMLGKAGNLGTVTLHIWCGIDRPDGTQEVSKRPVIEVYAELLRSVRKNNLQLEGHTVSYLYWRLITVLQDPVAPAFHGVAACEIQTQVSPS